MTTGPAVGLQLGKGGVGLYLRQWHRLAYLTRRRTASQRRLRAHLFIGRDGGGARCSRQRLQAQYLNPTQAGP
jgi:hypothetical protein